MNDLLDLSTETFVAVGVFLCCVVFFGIMIGVSIVNDKTYVVRHVPIVRVYCKVDSNIYFYGSEMLYREKENYFETANLVSFNKSNCYFNYTGLSTTLTFYATPEEIKEFPQLPLQ